MSTKEKREFWLQHIEAWQQSGLSRSDYITIHELSSSQFSYYFRRHYQTPSSTQPDTEAVALVPVDVVPEEKPSGESSISCLTLTTPQGYRIELLSGFDPELLQQVIKVVEAA